MDPIGNDRRLFYLRHQLFVSFPLETSCNCGAAEGYERSSGSRFGVIALGATAGGANLCSVSIVCLGLLRSHGWLGTLWENVPEKAQRYKLNDIKISGDFAGT